MSRGLAMRAVYAFGCTLMMASGCTSTHMSNQEGGETHFMKDCLDRACEGDLSCVCGVCTKACDNDSQCAALGERATCRAVAPDSLVCGDDAPDENRVCDVTCGDSSECEALGSSYTCIESRCRPDAIASAIADLADADDMDAGDMDASAVDAAPIGDDAGDGCSGSDCGASVAPLVMILIDTSGSMERKTDCQCTTPSCVECLPDCDAEAPEKNRWTQALEALTGTYDGFECEALQRVGADFTYDAEYTFPYNRPGGTQRDDGALREYEESLRFGIATFEGVATYGRDTQLTLEEFDLAMSGGEAGMWSYPPSSRDGYRYPNCENEYYMNTGIRNRDAESGRLIIESSGQPNAATVAAIEQTLRVTRPFGSTPIAASLDDIRWLMESDPMMVEERDNPLRQRHLILITDGKPDDDYRNVGCDCFADGDASDCGGAPNDPALMHCPYALPEETARMLRCGDLESCDSGAFETVHVIGFVIDDAITEDRLDKIARNGGDPSARQASDGEELRRELGILLEDIASGRYRNGGSVPDPIIRETCEIDGRRYEHGARLWEGCNECVCMRGAISCSEASCQQCEADSDCDDDQLCHFGINGDCATGRCGQPTLECDRPINAREVCGCNDVTYDSSDCTSLIKGIASVGACEIPAP